jgi:hypothetical protein
MSNFITLKINIQIPYNINIDISSVSQMLQCFSYSLRIVAGMIKQYQRETKATKNLQSLLYNQSKKAEKV